MYRILIVLKKENGPRASSAPAMGLNTITFKYVYWHMKQISGERLQDHWSSGIFVAIALDESIFLGVLHFPMKNIMSRDLEATPMGGATSKPPSDVVCLLLLS